MKYIVILAAFLIGSFFPSSFGAEMGKVSQKQAFLASLSQKTIDLLFSEENSYVESSQLRSDEIVALGSTPQYLQGFLDISFHTDDKCRRSTEMYHGGYKLNACIPQYTSGAFKLSAQIVDGNVRAYKQNYVDIDCNEADGPRVAWKRTAGMCRQYEGPNGIDNIKAQINPNYWDGVYRNREMSNPLFRGADKCEAGKIEDVLQYTNFVLGKCVNVDTSAYTDYRFTTCNPADSFFTEVDYTSNDITCTGDSQTFEYDRGCGGIGNELFMKQICL